MYDHADLLAHNEGNDYARGAHRSPLPTSLHGLLAESFPLLAEDLRAARVGLGITSTRAAELAELDPALYLALEEGTAVGNVENVGLMVSAAKCLGLKEVRFSHLDLSYLYKAQQQYLKVDLSTDRPLTIFLDTLRLDVRELKEQSVFVSPSQVLALVEHLGFNKTFDSRQPVDKQLIELWIAALITLHLDPDLDYYVRLVRNDPPDTEVLAINGADRNIRGVAVEITQHGVHSRNLLDVIRNKLRKMHQKRTVLVVLVEQQQDILIGDLDEFMRTNNPYNHQVFIIGGSETPGVFKVVPLNEVNKPTPGEIAWSEISVDAKNASKGFLGHDGVIFKPPGSWFLPPHPVFVKDLNLSQRTMME